MCDKIHNDWQTKMKSIKQRIGYVYNNELFTDVEFFVVSKEEEVSFRAHKFILTLASPVFASIFNHEKNGKEKKIMLSNVSPDGFGHLLKYVYTDEISFQNTDDAFATYKAAVEFKLPVLKAECEKYLLKGEYSSETLCRALENATLYNIIALKDRCLNLLEQKTREVLNSVEFKKADLRTVESILKLPKVALSSEYELLMAVIEWGKAQPSETKYLSLRSIIEPLFCYIKFTSFSSQELTKIFDAYRGLFSESEALSFYMNISQPGIRDLPSWCNTSLSREYTAK